MRMGLILTPVLVLLDGQELTVIKVSATCKYSKLFTLNPDPACTCNMYMLYCKFISVCEGFIWRNLQPSLKSQNKYQRSYFPVTRKLAKVCAQHEY